MFQCILMQIIEYTIFFFEKLEFDMGVKNANELTDRGSYLFSTNIPDYKTSPHDLKQGELQNGVIIDICKNCLAQSFQERSYEGPRLDSSWVIVEGGQSQADKDEDSIEEWTFVEKETRLPSISHSDVEAIREQFKRILSDFHKKCGSISQADSLERVLLDSIYNNPSRQADTCSSPNNHVVSKNNTPFALFLSCNKNSLRYLKDFYAVFNKNIALAYEQAEEIHQEFLVRAQGEILPVTDAKTSTTVALFSHLYFAFEKTRVVFAPLLQIAKTAEQESQIARLVQIILCGKNSLTDISWPASPFCFYARELLNKTSLPILVPIENGITAIEYYLSQQLVNQTFKKRLEESVGAFFKDVVYRKGNRLDCAGRQFHCDTSDFQNESFVLRGVNEIFSSYLKTEYQAIPHLIERHKNSKFLEQVQRAFGDSGTDFSIDTFRAILKGDLTRKLEEDVVEQIVAMACFSPADLQILVDKSGCEEGEIQSLMPAKLLEVMTMMNQGFLSHSFAPLFVLAQSENMSYSVFRKHSVYHYLANSFDSLRNENTYYLGLNSALSDDSNLLPQLSERVDMVRIQNILSIPDLHEKTNHNVKIIALRDICFSYRAIPSMMNFIKDTVHCEGEAPTESNWRNSVATFVAGWISDFSLS